MTEDEILHWLMQGDVCIAYQCARDLLDEERPDLQARMVTEGWGKAYLDARNNAGGWGTRYYGARWANSHYILLELANMAFPPDHPDIAALVGNVARDHVAMDGGLGERPGERKSDTCVTGMFLNIACHFRVPEPVLRSFVDFLISVQMTDGGFNCQINRSGCRHSSLHSTISVLEGFARYDAGGYRYRNAELLRVAAEARKFILRHNFYRSDRTGNIIRSDFLRLSYPPRWYYNILRSLDYFQATDQDYDPAMRDALTVLSDRRRADGRWNCEAKIPGKILFEMETPGKSGRWNTLLAMRVLRAYSRG